MRAGQLAGWALLLFLGVTVFSLMQLHSLSAQHDDSLDARHRFAIDFGHIARRSGPATRAAASGEGDKRSTVSGRWSHAASQLHVGEQESVVAARLGLVSGSTGSGSSVSDVSTTSADSSSSSSGGGASGLTSSSTQGHAGHSDSTSAGAAQGSDGGTVAAEPEVVVTSRGKCYAYPQVDSWGNALPGEMGRGGAGGEMGDEHIRMMDFQGQVLRFPPGGQLGNALPGKRGGEGLGVRWLLANGSPAVRLTVGITRCQEGEGVRRMQAFNAPGQVPHLPAG